MQRSLIMSFCCRAELWQIHWPVGIPLLVVPPLLSVLNLLWFSKIARGAVKLFFSREPKARCLAFLLKATFLIQQSRRRKLFTIDSKHSMVPRSLKMLHSEDWGYQQAFASHNMGMSNAALHKCHAWQALVRSSLLRIKASSVIGFFKIWITLSCRLLIRQAKYSRGNISGFSLLQILIKTVGLFGKLWSIASRMHTRI